MTVNPGIQQSKGYVMSWCEEQKGLSNICYTT
jgi:hypothetical protein